MTEHRNTYLFEVSWEVCNKVGGIHTVLTSKMREVLRTFGDRCILLGPDLKNYTEFEETDEECWNRIREATAIKELPCRFGRWRIPGRPKVILVEFRNRYDKDQLLFRIWENWGVDSMTGGWDYVEPVMFSSAAGEVIETAYNVLARPAGNPAIAHFHEWMCGAGLLYLKRRIPEMATVFTTHATILGRTLSGTGMDLYGSMEHLSPQREAVVHNISAKFSMEQVAAREADCFTTVSEITALEARNILGRSPDVITPNGLDMETIPDLTEDREPSETSRRILLEAASRFLRRDLPQSSRIFLTSGRYEFHNKGIDVFLGALGRLERELEAEQSAVAFLFVMGGHMDLLPSLKEHYTRTDSGPLPIATHRLHYGASDPVMETCKRLGLRNMPENRVSVIFVPAPLDGKDGFLNLPYYEALQGCDMGVFPSYYEPWGYTPLECAAFAVPTVSTDLAGFGQWVRQMSGGYDGVRILDRRNQEPATVEEELKEILRESFAWTEPDWLRMRKGARLLALHAGWHDFYGAYLAAYDRALGTAFERSAKMAVTEDGEKKHVFAGTASTQPHFRTFTAVAHLPEKIGRLRELAYNLWWVWTPRALDLFATLDPKLWLDMGNNPVRMLETVSSERISEAAENPSYMALYGQIMGQFDDYMEEKTSDSNPYAANGIRWSSPVAYFSTEYGLHECLPIYSGGLGTLSGDHLKTASDMNIPLVGVGLLYKNGYFRQLIDRNGIQVAEYPENDFSSLPVQIVRDDLGADVQISLELPGRTLYANIWEIKVGRVSLYLLDTDVPRNTLQDRSITSRLYGADPRVRIEQEILLGAGGVRLLKKLGIRPRVYHINEGHSAFLIFERTADLMSGEGLSLEEAAEVVHGSTVFTTHTPVEAGNERFSKDLIESYLGGYMKRFGLSWARFWDLGRKERGDDKPFFMTILALKMSHRSNAVSNLHGQVARHMWRDVWKGFDDSDIPIGQITNGVHVMSYIAPRMKECFDTYLGMDWEKHLTDPERWRRIQDIPDIQLWRIRHEMKQRLLDYLRDYTAATDTKFPSWKNWREDMFSRLNPSALLIGFARRFAPYKRADLLLSDLDRLDRIVNHPTRPVHILFAGKAHPNDDMGKNLVKRVIDVCRDVRFRGRIFFIEDYSLGSARMLVQGVDLWLNTPRRPYEASGTSGMKVAANGVLNLSVSDGWWPEGFDGTNGWTMGPLVRQQVEERPNADEEDGRDLYDLLEETVIPTFYDRDLSGVPERWMAAVKRSMQTLVPKFNTERMLSEYYSLMYRPAAQRDQELTSEGFALARTIVDWKRKVPMRFSSLKLQEVSIGGIHGDTIVVDQPLSVQVRIDPGKMAPEEILVEMVVGLRDSHGFTGSPQRVPLKVADVEKSGMLVFSGEYTVRENGMFSYGIRVLPFHPQLATLQEMGLILWG
ncbi:MAG TPA: alpha-glucan family phosphorylase [Syntrophales bacterium]|nr:alpha-glucan family phosphorylase [Syntrophales bacterium]